MDIPWPRASLARFLPQMELADPVMRETSGAKIWLLGNPDRADIFFQGTGHRLAEILAAAKAGRPLPKFPLAASFPAKMAVSRSEVEAPTVIGLVPGHDPKLKD